MQNLSARLVLLALLAIAVFSAMSLNSCKDKFITQAPDTIIHHDTIRTVPDTTRVVIHDTVDLDDSSVWVYRASGTTDDLVIVQFPDQNNGYIGGSHGIILGTANGGINWNTHNYLGTEGNGGTVIYGLSFLDLLTGWAVGDGNYVYHTIDGGFHWDSTLVNTTYFLRTTCFLDANNGFIGTSDPSVISTGPYPGPGHYGQIFATHNGGKNWTSTPIGSGGIMYIRFINSTNGVAIGRYGTAFWTSDGGTTWKPGTSDLPGGVLNKCVFTSANTGFAVGYIDTAHGVILRTDDAGHSWQTIRSTPFLLQGIATNGNGMVTACGWGGNISESTDGGTTWKESQIGTIRWIDVVYSSVDRTILVGKSGRIATRDK